MTLPRQSLRGAALILLLLTVGCTYLGSARDFDPETLDRDPGWLAVRRVPPVRQLRTDDCGVAALQMVLAYWDHPVDREVLLSACPLKEGEGVKAGDLKAFARSYGLQAFLIHGEWPDFETELSRGHPIIVGMVKPYITGNFSHYEVVVALNRETHEIVTLDPACGWRINTAEGFRKEWDPAGRVTLILFKKLPERPADSGGR